MTHAAPIRLVRDGERKKPLRFNFTVRQLDRIRPTPWRQVWVYDDNTDGLAMVTYSGGDKTFFLAKRMDGRYRRVKIGPFPEVKIEQARNQARKLIGQMAQGENPADARQQARAAMTFGELFSIYMTKHAKLHKRTWQEDQRQYDRYLKRWSGRRLDQISRQDVTALHAKIGKDTPTQANRVLALASKLFNYAASIGFDGRNPAKGVKKFAEQARERFIDVDEMPRFLAAVEAEADTTFRDFFRLLLFTGQRRENVASMQWDELDFGRSVWTIPAAKFKTGQAVEVPLVPQAVTILTSRRHTQADLVLHGKYRPNDPRLPYVFPSKRRESVKPHMYEPKMAFTRVCERAEIRGLVLHDLRRTVASWATMQGVPYPVVARMVGHKAQGVTSIYARFDLQAVRDGFARTVNAMVAAKGGE